VTATSVQQAFSLEKPPTAQEVRLALTHLGDADDPSDHTLTHEQRMGIARRFSVIPTLMFTKTMLLRELLSPSFREALRYAVQNNYDWCLADLNDSLVRAYTKDNRLRLGPGMEGGVGRLNEVLFIKLPTTKNFNLYY
jgi:hypothetical protein